MTAARGTRITIYSTKNHTDKDGIEIETKKDQYRPRLSWLGFASFDLLPQSVTQFRKVSVFPSKSFWPLWAENFQSARYNILLD